MRTSSYWFYLLISMTLLGCSEGEADPILTPQSILDQIDDNYILMPERAISISSDSTVFALYTEPTERYAHGILGDQVEGGQLVVVKDGVFYELTLADNYVFEDIRPRFYDVDQDGELEFVALRTEITRGAGIVIYKLVDGQIVVYTELEEIGRSNRWLNIVAIQDLDMDGQVEISWIETPHIGGVLKVADVEKDELIVLDQVSGYSNHAIGERNLCLSVVTRQNDQTMIFVPNQSRSKIGGFSFSNDKLELVSELDIRIDFAQVLSAQYKFEGVVMQEEHNCIF